MLWITAISDTHTMHRDLNGMPDSGDILIHAGDFSGHSTEEDLIDFNAWLASLDYKHKIVVPGNHDRIFERHEQRARILLPQATVLIDQCIEVEGVKIYGSPWTPRFGHWSFMQAAAELKEKWEQIPNDLDILITKRPPKYVLDEVLDYVPHLNSYEPVHTGCAHLFNKVMHAKPKYHIFGHIHEGFGAKEIQDTLFLNVACLNERYQPVNSVTVFAIENTRK